MKRYQSYKSSGVDWIDVIPSHWTIKRVGQIFKERSEKVNDTDFEPLSVTKNGVVPQMEGIAKTENNDNRKLVRKGDFVINSRSDRKGSSGFSKLDGSVSVINIVLEPKEIFPKYSHYLFRSYLFVEEFFRNGKGIVMDLWSTRFNEMKYMNIPYPLISEQHQIVRFLDEKTELIDRLISTKERKITLLKEQRTSLINQVVTRGLIPNVKMKESGVEWIGEIPEHWISLGFTKIIKIRHGYQFREYDFTDNGIKIVKITQLDKEGCLNLDNCSFIDENRLDEFERILIEESDVLMCLTGGTIGKIIKVGKVDEPLVQNYRVGHFSPLNDNIINDYVFWFMSSSLTTSQMFSEIRETGQPNIGMEDFGKMKVILPPVNEQLQIVEHLESKTKEIDDLVQLEQKKIDLLKEYRQSLISEVVTGKIKVTTD